MCFICSVETSKRAISCQTVSKFEKMVEKANSHAVSKYHLDAIEMAYTFVQQRIDPSSTVACKLDTKNLKISEEEIANFWITSLGR